jgi:D-3-phosphoglycerate dehydrogenase
MKILVAEHIADEGIHFLNQTGFDVDIKLKLSRQELLDCIGVYDAIIVRSVTKVNEELYEHATNLKVVGRAGNGVDNIEMAGATKRGIIVVNTPDANTVSAAEHTIGLMLSMCRNIPRANAHIKSKQWDRTLFRGVELMDKTLGVVGLGRIGSMVATRMQAFGMNVIAYDPYIRRERFEQLKVTRVDDLNELMRQADIITVHTPKTKETLSIISTAEFKLCKKGVRVVNCARGGIIDEAALLEAIENGIVAGAAIDVLKDEPHPISPLLDLDQTVITPHLGADTYEAQKNVGEAVALEVFEALQGKLVANAVNLPSLKSQELEALHPYLKLAEYIGKLYHQIRRDAVQKIELIYKGEVGKMDKTTLTLAYLKGLYEIILEDSVNYVNARYIAESRGVTIVEGTDTITGNYTSSIAVKIHTINGVFTLEGALFGKDEPRIVDMNGYAFDVSPKGNMLLIENIDQPGMIGKIGQTLGNECINISTMNVSLSKTSPNALMFLTVDAPVSAESLDVIRNTDGIKNAWALKM